MSYLRVIFISLPIFFINLQIAEGKPRMSERSWFNSTRCNSLEIKKYKSVSNHDVVAEIAIKDLQVIKRLIERIEKIPRDGDMMVSFGPDAAHTELIFHCDSQKTAVEVYQKGFKTPSTGFNSDKGEIEKSLVEDIAFLLAPDLGQRILKVPGLELKFKKFSVTYKGGPATPKPVGFSTISESFVIKNNQGKEQTIQVSSQIQKFEVDGKTYSFRPAPDLLPEYFEIKEE